MFTILQPYIDASVKYTNRAGAELVFHVENIINRKLREQMAPKDVYYILNKFIEFKGPDFDAKLYNILLKSKNTLIDDLDIPDLDIPPMEIIHDVLDLFDYKEVKDFIVTNRLITPPINLPREYDDTRELDGKGSREQTYIKDDYISLIALITILKATGGCIGQYASNKINLLDRAPLKEYVLFNLYRTHDLYKTEPSFIKIVDSLSKLVERLFKSEEATSIRIIEKTISRDTIPIYITGLTVIHKLLFNNELSDDIRKNTVTKIYGYATDQLRSNDNGKVKIKYTMNSDSSVTESDSAFESGRVSTTVTVGNIMEFKYNSSDPYRLARQIGITSTKAVINSTLKAFKYFIEDSSAMPIDESVYISAWILASTVDPRSVDYIEEEVYTNLALSFLWLYEHGYIDLAYIICSFHSHASTTFKMNITQKVKISAELKDELNRRYGHNKLGKVNSKDKEISYIENTINVYTKALASYNLYSILPEAMLMSLTNSRSREVIVPGDIKSQLAKLSIELDSI